MDTTIPVRIITIYVSYPWSSNSAGILIQQEHWIRFSTNLAQGRQSRIRILNSESFMRLYSSCADINFTPSVTSDEVGDSTPLISAPKRKTNEMHATSIQVKQPIIIVRGAWLSPESLPEKTFIYHLYWSKEA